MSSDVVMSNRRVDTQQKSWVFNPQLYVVAPASFGSAVAPFPNKQAYGSGQPSIGNYNLQTIKTSSVATKLYSGTQAPVTALTRGIVRKDGTSIDVDIVITLDRNSVLAFPVDGEIRINAMSPPSGSMYSQGLPLPHLGSEPTLRCEFLDKNNTPLLPSTTAGVAGQGNYMAKLLRDSSLALYNDVPATSITTAVISNTVGGGLNSLFGAVPTEDIIRVQVKGTYQI